MNEISTTKHSNLPLVISVIIAIVGLLAAGAFKSDLQQAKSDLQQAKSDLQQAKSDLQQAKSDIAKMEPLAAKAREMPITISLRGALLGSGYVLVLKSKATTPLSLNVTASDAAAKTSKSFRIVANPGFGGEIGHAEGWAFASGDTFEITCAGYDPIKKTVK